MKCLNIIIYRDLVSTVMFYLHIVIMNNRTFRIRIKYFLVHVTVKVNSKKEAVKGNE